VAGSLGEPGSAVRPSSERLTGNVRLPHDIGVPTPLIPSPVTLQGAQSLHTHFWEPPSSWFEPLRALTPQ
jgi:hypothetical protein